MLRLNKNIYTQFNIVNLTILIASQCKEHWSVYVCVFIRTLFTGIATESIAINYFMLQWK